MDSKCLIVNCNRKAPDDEAFCAKHRRDDKTKAANLRAAHDVIAEQLEIRQRLEEERQEHLEAITNLGAIITRLRRRSITHVCASDAPRIAAWLRSQCQDPMLPEFAEFLSVFADAVEKGDWQFQPVTAECPASHDGLHHVDTTMKSGPYNCFHCERPMR